jgi:membrane protease YdiL (CAAX protease family)
VTGKPGRPARRRADVAFAAAGCIVLAGYNNVAGARPWHRRWYPAVNALAATAALAAAAASGLTAADLGLRRDQLRSGLSLGSAAAAPIVAAFGLAALTPATRPLLNDQRIAGLDRRQLAYHVLLRIPVGTVAWEEIAFRGVLHGALRRVLAEPAATAVGSAVFGLWHIRPTAEALAVNRLAADRGARVAAVAGVVVGTAGAGAVLSLLRERSGSLAAPVLLHLAANCAGPLASLVAQSEQPRRRPILRLVTRAERSPAPGGPGRPAASRSPTPSAETAGRSRQRPHTAAALRHHECRTRWADPVGHGYLLLLTKASVDPFAQQVGVAHGPGVLLDHPVVIFAQARGTGPRFVSFTATYVRGWPATYAARRHRGENPLTARTGVPADSAVAVSAAR